MCIYVQANSELRLCEQQNQLTAAPALCRLVASPLALPPRPKYPGEDSLLTQLSVGAVFVVVSAVLHIAVLDLLGTRVRAFISAHATPLRGRMRLSVLCFATLGLFLSHIAQIWIWAVVYMLLGEFDDLETALYFSTATFTTLGFGDILASVEWRLMASCEAAAGMLLFGLSTAFLFEVLSEVLNKRRM